MDEYPGKTMANLQQIEGVFHSPCIGVDGRRSADGRVQKCTLAERSVGSIVG